MKKLSQQLQELPQVDMPVDIFYKIESGINDNLDKNNFIRKHRLISFMSLLAVLSISLLFIIQNNHIDEKDVLIQELVKRTIQLEQLLAVEEPTYSTPGATITEKIVNIESWLAKLDESINQTKDKQRLSELMATKLDLLGNLVLLQRKINQKPDYQKLKPYII
jgi:hypothetical protein